MKHIHYSCKVFIVNACIIGWITNKGRDARQIWCLCEQPGHRLRRSTPQTWWILVTLSCHYYVLVYMLSLFVYEQ